MELSDKAYNTFNHLRYATWLASDSDIEQACKELAEYLRVVREEAEWRQEVEAA